MMNALRITTDIANSYTGLLPVENNQLIYDSMFPTMAYVGSGRLLVDSIDYAGRLTYSPLADAGLSGFCVLITDGVTQIPPFNKKTEWKRIPKENIADNGQFLVGGGHQGRAVECELANVRLWTRWRHIITAEQLSLFFPAACPEPRSVALTEATRELFPRAPLGDLNVRCGFELAHSVS